VDREKETNVVRREWELKDLIECWTLDEAEFELLANKTGATRLGFALLLKFFELEARFPRREDVPRLQRNSWRARRRSIRSCSGSTAGRAARSSIAGAQIRDFHGFRVAAVGDEDKLIVWPAADICPMEMSRDRLRAALLARCR
jgi:hypothetical protein